MSRPALLSALRRRSPLSCVRDQRSSTVWVRVCQLALVLGLCLAQPAGASSPSATTIEEDWEIVIGDPDSDAIAPQLFVVTSPNGGIDGLYSVFEINNLSLPDFYGGGLQFQTWIGEDSVGECHENNFNSLSTAGETITFTVRMSLHTDSGYLSFRIKNGQSQTWGAFGTSNELRLFEQTNLTDLNGYSPDASAYYSRVGFGGTRVTKMVLKEVRYYQGSTLILTDSTVRDATVENP